MTIQNVYNTNVKAANITPVETFKGHKVVDGKVVKNWSDTLSLSSMSSLQKEYDDAKVAKQAWTWKTPLIAVKNAAVYVLDFIGGIFKTIFALCTYSKAEDKNPKTKA